MNETLKHNEELIAWLMMQCDRCNKKNEICTTPDGPRLQCYNNKQHPDYGECRYYLRPELYGLKETKEER